MDAPTYDPTDFGNEPGEGRLRAGSNTAASGSRDQKDLPSTRSKASARQQPSLSMVRDLWGGNETLHETGKGTTHLPRNPGEDKDAYQDRLNRAVFHNFFRRTVEGLTGLVFRVDPVLGEDVPSDIEQHWENIDLEGTHGDVFCRDILQDDIIAGHAAILVEFPQTDGNQTQAEELGPIRPYWVPIKKENIISWRTEKVSGKRVLSQVVLCEKAMVPDGEFGEREQVQYRVLRRDDSGVTWELLEVRKDKSVQRVGNGSYPTQEEIPLVEVPSSGRESLFDSTPPLLDFAYLNRAHYNQWSDQDTAIHKTCSPFLFLAGVEGATPPPEDGAPPPKVVVGPNTVATSRDPQAKAEYVSHDGQSLGFVNKALEELKSDMGTLGLAMLAPQKRSAETAEAKRLDKATSDSALAVTARALQDAIERCLHFHAKYLRGEQSGGSIQINRDFEGMVMEAPVMQAYAQLVNAGMPPRIALEMLKAGGRLPEDADLDDMEGQWLMGASVAQEIRETEGPPMDDAA